MKVPSIPAPLRLTVTTSAKPITVLISAEEVCLIKSLPLSESSNKAAELEESK